MLTLRDNSVMALTLFRFLFFLHFFKFNLSSSSLSSSLFFCYSNLQLLFSLETSQPEREMVNIYRVYRICSNIHTPLYEFKSPNCNYFKLNCCEKNLIVSGKTFITQKTMNIFLWLKSKQTKNYV